MKGLHSMLLATVLALPGVAQAKLNVFACEPEWGALVQELAAKHASVKTATTALQDPHRIQARPSLIAAVRRADLLVCTGADLEAGWLPLLLRRANNPKVLPGRSGYFEAAAQVRLRDVPATVDRAQGDVHPSGNPHLHTDPRNILAVAEALGGRLAELDAANAAQYRQRLTDFRGRWQQAMDRWQDQAQALRGMPVVSQHQSWTYLIAWLELDNVATLEPKPGLPPSSAHLAAVAAQLRGQPARAVLRAAYQDPQPSEWLAQQVAVRTVVLPYTVGGTPQATDLFGLFDDTLQRLLDAQRE